MKGTKMNYAQIIANNMKTGLENESEKIIEISRVLVKAGTSAIQHSHLMNDADFIPDVLSSYKDKPEQGKIYSLFGAKGEPCIAKGNTWAESEVKD
jgi:hypothetical protein